jgi:hypothetical protein
VAVRQARFKASLLERSDGIWFRKSLLRADRGGSRRPEYPARSRPAAIEERLEA